MFYILYRFRITHYILYNAGLWVLSGDKGLGYLGKF